MLNQANSDMCLGTAEDFWQKREERGRHRCCLIHPTRACGVFCGGGNHPTAKLVAVREAGLDWAGLTAGPGVDICFGAGVPGAR